MSSGFNRLWEETNYGAILLSPLAAIYALGWLGYESLYRFGLKKAKEPHVPVVCIGNLLVGGTGKTPLVLYVARMLREAGREVVISASGYGSPSSRSAQLAPLGDLDPAKWGDEPAMMRWFEPEIPMIVGRDRVEAARICAANFPNAVLLLDDGFQHLPLKKHVTIVIDPPHPANKLCLPAGPYREPRIGLRRATIVLPRDFELKPSPLRFVGRRGEAVEPELGEVDVLTAIARPQRLLDSLAAMGMEPRTVRCPPDHDPLRSLDLLAPFEGIRRLVVTAKDWVKLRQREDIANRDILIGTYDMDVEPEATFRDRVMSELGRALGPSE